MIDYILIIIILGIIGLASWYIYREKKKGNKCIGCPNAKNCGMKKDGCCKEDC